MNQILNFKKDGKIQDDGIKPIIKFFIVIIILFALIIISHGVYNIIYNKNLSDNINGAPILNAEQNGSSVILTIEYKKGIDKIIYHWNNGEEAILQTTGKNKVQQEIPLPIGTNTLNISVIDVNGKMTRYEPKQFVFDSSIDSNKPQIEIVKGSGIGTIKMIVTDDKAIKSVTYQWSEDDVMTPEVPEGATSFELELAAKEGERTLTIIAIDTSDNEEKVTKTIKGSKKPELSVLKDGGYLIINATDDDKISKLEYDFNGQTNVIENIDQAQYEYRLELVSGENYVIVTATDIDGLTTQYKGKCNF